MNFDPTFWFDLLIDLVQEVLGIINGNSEGDPWRYFHGVYSDSFSIQIHQWATWITKLEKKKKKRLVSLEHIQNQGKKETIKNCLVLDMGGKSQNGENPCNETENTIHMQGSSRRWGLNQGPQK